MQEHASLKELLEDYDEFQRVAPPLWNGDKIRDKYVASNSLALGKPEPLEKNKQCDDDFICYQKTRGFNKCNLFCGDDSLCGD